MPLYACLRCGTPSKTKLCPRHTEQLQLVQREIEKRRGNAAQRGYNQKWRRNRARFLKHNPTCIDCGQPATVADHAPKSRKQLLAAGDPNPDAWHHLQPRCHHCHSHQTGLNQPGGFNRP